MNSITIICVAALFVVTLSSAARSFKDQFTIQAYTEEGSTRVSKIMEEKPFEFPSHKQSKKMLMLPIVINTWSFTNATAKGNFKIAFLFIYLYANFFMCKSTKY